MNKFEESTRRIVFLVILVSYLISGVGSYCFAQGEKSSYITLEGEETFIPPKPRIEITGQVKLIRDKVCILVSVECDLEGNCTYYENEKLVALVGIKVDLLELAKYEGQTITVVGGYFGENLFEVWNLEPNPENR